MTLLPVFWWGRVDNIQHLFRPLHQLCRVPIDVVGRFKSILTYIIPSGLCGHDSGAGVNR